MTDHPAEPRQSSQDWDKFVLSERAERCASCGQDFQIAKGIPFCWAIHPQTFQARITSLEESLAEARAENERLRNKLELGSCIGCPDW